MKKEGAGERLFDEWPERYDAWFETPIGRLVRDCEGELILDLLRPAPGERILDAGCGTGVFTVDILESGAGVTGLDLSLPMLKRAREKAEGRPFHATAGDMLSLPFADGAFDKTISVTALEFVSDARVALEELSRVTKSGGTVVAATLNALSPWAARRRAAAEKNARSIFKHVFFRSPDELKAAMPREGEIRTAVHFLKDEDPSEARRIESEGQSKALDTGAFLAARWVKP